MADESTIDAAGRVVIPKRLRERLRLTPGTRLYLREEDGRLVIAAERPEPRVIERHGFLVLDLDLDGAVRVDAGSARDDRIRELVEYAVRR